jgi:hypothetical protein
MSSDNIDSLELFSLAGGLGRCPKLSAKRTYRTRRVTDVNDPLRKSRVDPNAVMQSTAFRRCGRV